MTYLVNLLFVLKICSICHCIRNDDIEFVNHEKFNKFVTTPVRLLQAMEEGNNTKQWFRYIRWHFKILIEHDFHNVLQRHHLNRAFIKMFLDSCNTVSVLARPGYDWSPLADHLRIPIEDLPCRGIEINEHSIDSRLGTQFEIRVLDPFSINITVLRIDLPYTGSQCYHMVLQLLEVSDSGQSNDILLHVCGLMRKFGHSFMVLSHRVLLKLKAALRSYFTIKFLFQIFDVDAERIQLTHNEAHVIRGNNKGYVEIWDNFGMEANMIIQSVDKIYSYFNFIIAYDILYEVVIESVLSNRCGDYLEIYDGLDDEVVLQNVTMCESYVEELVATSHVVYMRYFRLDSNIGIFDDPTIILFTRQELEAIYIPESNDTIQIAILHQGLPVGLDNQQPITHIRWVIPTLNMKRKLIFHNVILEADTAFFCLYGGIYIKHQIFQKESSKMDTIDYGPYCAGECI